MIWIDTDVALGGECGDVDDGYALAALFAASRRGDPALAGVSTVFGNTSARLSEGFARQIAELSGISLPVVRGAERPGETEVAAERIASLETNTELLALGPLTNVAAACRLDASLPGYFSARRREQPVLERVPAAPVALRVQLRARP
jgi:inosine-uridine nucleoside N-ribohydrolase